MSDDKPMKSSFELAMERLRKRDVDEGVEAKPLSPASDLLYILVIDFNKVNVYVAEVISS